jgi:hypothetical protein
VAEEPDPNHEVTHGPGEDGQKRWSVWDEGGPPLAQAALRRQKSANGSLAPVQSSASAGAEANGDPSTALDAGTSAELASAPGLRREQAGADEAAAARSDRPGGKLAGWLSRRRMNPAATWLIGAIGAGLVGAVIAVPVTGVLDPDEQASSRATAPKPGRSTTSTPDPFYAGPRSKSGFGPARPVFRCTRPNECAGPDFVTFNSYMNNPVIGDERYFLAVTEASTGDAAPVVDSIQIEKPTELVFRVSIDNNAFQVSSQIFHIVPFMLSTDAMATRLRVALPDGPTYDSFPTAYLRAANTKPQTIWDTVRVFSARPMTLTYIPGSAFVDRGTGAGKVITQRLDDAIVSSQGASLGAWKADFPFAGYVTFRVRATPLPEPVRDPRATRPLRPDVTYPPPSDSGEAKEPVHDGTPGDQFLCQPASCVGAPYVTLNAYSNHPVLGDEADFMRGMVERDFASTETADYRTVALVQPGDNLRVRVAIDNGADPQAVGAPGA